MTIERTFIIEVYDDGMRWTADYPGDDLLNPLCVHSITRRGVIRKMRRKIRKCHLLYARIHQTKAQVPVTVEVG